MQIKNKIIQYIKTRMNIYFIISGILGLIVISVISNEKVNSLNLKLLWYIVFAILIYIGNFDKEQEIKTMKITKFEIFSILVVLYVILLCVLYLPEAVDTIKAHI